MQKITDNVFVETRFVCNTGLVVTKQGVVAIDTPMNPADAVKWRAEIAKHGSLCYLINTEPHQDHITGNYFYDVPIVAHVGTRKVILANSAEQYKEQMSKTNPESMPLLKGFWYRLPTITFTDQLTLHVGDHTFELVHLPGHTASNLAVYVPEEKVVFTSDNLTVGVQAWMHDALPFDWLQSLDRISQLDADVLVPGHGDVTTKAILPEMKALVETWIDSVSAAKKKGMSLEQATATIGLPMMDKRPVPPGAEQAMEQMRKWNIARLYSVMN